MVYDPMVPLGLVAIWICVMAFVSVLRVYLKERKGKNGKTKNL